MGRARGDERGPGDDSGNLLGARDTGVHMHPVLSYTPKRLAGMPTPEAKTRPVSFPARRLRAIEGGRRHAAPDAIGP